MSTTTNIISEKTPVTISLLVAAVGGISWLTTLHVNGAATALEVKEIKLEQKEMKIEFARDIKQLLQSNARIEGALKIKRPNGQE
jgi:hypothetical protein